MEIVIHCIHTLEQQQKYKWLYKLRTTMSSSLFSDPGGFNEDSGSMSTAWCSAGAITYRDSI